MRNIEMTKNKLQQLYFRWLEIQISLLQTKENSRRGDIIRYKNTFAKLLNYVWKNSDYLKKNVSPLKKSK
jgi:hypothetical protein